MADLGLAVAGLLVPLAIEVMKVTHNIVVRRRQSVALAERCNELAGLADQVIGREDDQSLTPELRRLRQPLRRRFHDLKKNLETVSQYKLFDLILKAGEISDTLQHAEQILDDSVRLFDHVETYPTLVAEIVMKISGLLEKWQPENAEHKEEDERVMRDQFARLYKALKDDNLALANRIIEGQAQQLEKLRAEQDASNKQLARIVRAEGDKTRDLLSELLKLQFNGCQRDRPSEHLKAQIFDLQTTKFLHSFAVQRYDRIAAITSELRKCYPRTYGRPNRLRLYVRTFDRQETTTASADRAMCLSKPWHILQDSDPLLTALPSRNSHLDKVDLYFVHHILPYTIFHLVKRLKSEEKGIVLDYPTVAEQLLKAVGDDTVFYRRVRDGVMFSDISQLNDWGIEPYMCSMYIECI